MKPNTATNSQIDNKHNNVVNETVDNVKQMPREQQSLVMQKLEMFSGPIPAPDILKRYNEMDPGAAKQIIDNGVEESHHRRILETKIVEIDRLKGIRRDWMAFFIGTLSILIGGLLLYQDHYVVGTVFSGISIVGLVGMFLGSNQSSRTNDESDSNKSSN